MTHLTTLEDLKEHIALLARVEQSDAPFISCYFNLENEQPRWRDVLEERASILRRIFKGDDRSHLEKVLTNIESWLASNVLPEAKGVAIFARSIFGGSFMLPMQFAVALPNLVAIYPTPNIYHLMELKDNYHRYIVMIATTDWARILEVNLGAATIRAWINEPDLRMRVEQEWSRSHFQVHQPHRGERFVQEKIAVLEQLMQYGGHTHLILAGDPKITQRVYRALPQELLDKLVDIVPADAGDQQSDVVMATLASFICHEEQESRSVADRLIEGLRRQNLAVAGSAATLDALRWADVDTLVMARDYQPDPGWECASCKAAGTETPDTATCSHCGEAAVRPLDLKEKLLRLAGQLECPVEVVEKADVLLSLGGVGCLLRTHLGAQATHQLSPASRH